MKNERERKPSSYDLGVILTTSFPNYVVLTKINMGSGVGLVSRNSPLLLITKCITVPSYSLGLGKLYHHLTHQFVLEGNILRDSPDGYEHFVCLYDIVVR